MMVWCEEGTQRQGIILDTKEEEIHINVGLTKVAETVAQIKEMKKISV